MNAREIEKLTVIKLREECLKIPNIVGVHGMTKEQLIQELKEFNDIPLEVLRRPKDDIKAIKKKVKELHQEMAKARGEGNKQRVAYLQGRSSTLKKKTRGV